MNTSVTILETRGDVSLLEWTDANGVHRAFIPASELREIQEQAARVDSDILAQGIGYGARWELLPIGQVGANVLAQALRGRGIWNFQDAKTRVNEVRAALNDAYSNDLRTILEAARNSSLVTRGEEE